MTEEEFDKEILQETVQAVYTAYEKGYNKACENIVDALGLIPVSTITKEHAIKLIGIVQRASKKYMDEKL